MMIDKSLLKLYSIRRIFLAPFFIITLLQESAVVGQAYCASMLAAGVFLSEPETNQVVEWLLLLLLFIFLRAVCKYSAGNVALRIREDVQEQLRRSAADSFFSSCRSLPGQTGRIDLAPVMTVSIPAVARYYSDYLPQLAGTAIALPLLLSAALWADAWSALLLGLTVPLLPVFMYLIGQWSGREQKRQWDAMYRLSGHFQDVLRGLVTLKLFGRSHEQGEIIRRVSFEYGKVTMRVLRLSFLSSFTLELAATISIAVVAVSLGLRLLYGEMEYQPALFILLLAPDYYLPLRSLGAKFHMGMNASAGAARIITFLRQQENSLPGGGKKESEAGSCSCKVDFVGAGCTYPGRGVTAVDGISFSIAPGGYAAVTGATGAGKSTLAGLLLGFAPLTAGKILIDGTDINDYSREELRALIAWLPQEPYIFPGSVRENLLLAKPESNDDEVQSALRHAMLWEEIAAMPNGLEQRIGDGGWVLSPGQIQRLGMARVILSGRGLVIIDEPASSLDSVNEEKMRRAVKDLSGKCTIIAVTHRSGMAADADKVIFLKNGRMAGLGHHLDLLEENVLYRSCMLGRCTLDS